MKKILVLVFAVLAFATQSRAAWVYGTNILGNSAAAAAKPIIFQPTNTPFANNNQNLVTSEPIKVYLNSSGSFSNKFEPGGYTVSSDLFRDRFGIVVPNDSGVYDWIALRAGTNINAVTNIAPAAPFATVANLQATNSALETRIGNATNALLGRTVQTFDTIADMIAATPATNVCYVKAYSGTNGIGGGLFELRGTNGYATNTGTIFASQAARKFWFRVFTGPVNVEWFGAKHDGVTEDSAAIQAAINYSTNAQGSVYFPMDTFGRNYQYYRITNTIFATNVTTSFGFSMAGDIWATRGPTASEIRWEGTNGATMFYMVGLNNTEIKNLSFNCNSKAKIGMVCDSGQGLSAGAASSGIRFNGCGFIGYTGAGSAGVSLSRAGGSGNQISEVSFDYCSFAGTTGSDNGFVNITGSNCKNFRFRNVVFYSHTNDVNLANGSSLVEFHTINSGNSRTNVFGASTKIHINDWYGEADGCFVYMPPNGANAESLLIENCEWDGVCLSTNDLVIHSSGALTLLNNSIWNARLTNSIPRIVVSRPGSSAVNISSIGNLYISATVPPFYDNLNAGGDPAITDTNNWVFGSSVTTNIYAFSMNDYGRTEWGVSVMVPFKTYMNGNGLILATINQQTNPSPVAVLGVDANGKVGVAALSAGSGEVNVTGEISKTNSTVMGLTYDKSGVTNRLRSLRPGYGIAFTNESTNIVIAVDSAVVTGSTNLVTIASGSGTFGGMVITNSLTVNTQYAGSLTISNITYPRSAVWGSDGNLTNSSAIANWSIYDTNAISTTASNAANNIATAATNSASVTNWITTRQPSAKGLSNIVNDALFDSARVASNIDNFVGNVETRLIATNSSTSNITVAFKGHTNTVYLYLTNNATFTNWTTLASGLQSSALYIIRPQLITRGVNWGNLGGSNPGYGVAIYTNANNLLWTWLTNGKTYALSMQCIETNIFPTLTLWE
jgi:hypothetical protein